MILAMLRELASISSLEWKCCAGSASSFFWKSAMGPASRILDDGHHCRFDPRDFLLTELVNVGG